MPLPQDRIGNDNPLEPLTSDYFLDPGFETWASVVCDRLRQNLAQEVADDICRRLPSLLQNHVRAELQQNAKRIAAPRPKTLPKQWDVPSSDPKANGTCMSKQLATAMKQQQGKSKLAAGKSDPVSDISVDDTTPDLDSRTDSAGRRFASAFETKKKAAIARGFSASNGRIDELVRQLEEPKSPFKSRIMGRLLQSHEEDLHKARDSAMSAVDSLIPTEDRCARKLVESQKFDVVCTAMIFFNCALIGVTTHYSVDHADEDSGLEIAAHVCHAFFFVELVIRIFAYGLGFFIRPERLWNMFDLILVCHSVVDVSVKALEGQSTERVSVLKSLKLLRVVRILRLFRFFKELAIMALMVMDSMWSLFWALVMLAVIIYLFAVVFTQLCVDWMNSNDASDHPDKAADVREMFGGIDKAVYSLVLAMLGGKSWGEVSNVLLHVSATSFALFLFYVAFTILAVLNIITGVFVENALETAKTQKDFIVRKQEKLKMKLVEELRLFFFQMDEDESGTIDIQELTILFQDGNAQAYFAALGMDAGDLRTMFQLLDDKDSGEVSVEEFLEGCLRLKGEARSIDVHACLREAQKVGQRMDVLHDQILLSCNASVATKAAEALDIVV